MDRKDPQNIIHRKVLSIRWYHGFCLQVKNENINFFFKRMNRSLLCLLNSFVKGDAILEIVSILRVQVKTIGKKQGSNETII